MEINATTPKAYSSAYDQARLALAAIESVITLNPAYIIVELSVGDKPTMYVYNQTKQLVEMK